LDINLQEKSPVQGVITIQIKEADYTLLVEEKIRLYGRKARIKGFRPGHIPTSLIHQMHGHGILVETITTLLADSLAKYLQERTIPIIGEPLLMGDFMQKISEPQQRDFEFTYEIGFVKAFDLVLTKDFTVTAYKLNQVADATLDKISKQLRSSKNQQQEVTHSELGDIVYGTLTHTTKNFTRDIQLLAQMPKKGKNILLNLQNTDTITVDMQELVQQGLHPINLSDEKLQELLALEGLCYFTVTKVGRPILAEFNQDFFDSILGKNVVHSLADFEAKLQEQVIVNKQLEADRFLDLAIQKALLEQAAITLPDDFLKRWLHHKHPSLDQKAIEAYYQGYAKALRWDLIAKKIIQENKLEVSHQAVVTEIKHRFKSLYNLPEEALDPLVQRFMKDNKGENYKHIYEELYLDQLLNFVKEQITMITQTISFEEFDTLLGHA